MKRFIRLIIVFGITIFTMNNIAIAEEIDEKTSLTVNGGTNYITYGVGSNEEPKITEHDDKQEQKEIEIEKPDTRQIYTFKDINSPEYINIVVIIGKTDKYYEIKENNDSESTNNQKIEEINNDKGDKNQKKVEETSYNKRYGYEIEPEYNEIYYFKLKREELNSFEIVKKEGNFYPFKYLVTNGQAEIYEESEENPKNEKFDTVIYEILNYKNSNLDIEFRMNGEKVDNLMNIDEVKDLIQKSDKIEYMKSEIKFIKGVLIFIAGVILAVVIFTLYQKFF